MKTAFLPSLCLIAVALAVAQTPEDASRTSRTSWGAPDLSGYWEYRTTTPLQRPEAFADKTALTPEEEAAYLKERLPAIRRERDLQLNADWWEAGGLTDGRTSLVIDPPPAGFRRDRQRRGNACGHSPSHFGSGRPTGQRTGSDTSAALMGRPCRCWP